VEPETTLEDVAGAVGELAEALPALVSRVEALEGAPQRRGYVPPDETPGRSLEEGPQHGQDGLVRYLGLQLNAVLQEGSGSGAFFVPDEYRPVVWDRLAAASVGLSSGFTVLEALTDTLHIPKITADAAAAWTSESATITAADPTADEDVARPRKLAALVAMSNEVIADSNPGVLQVVTQNLIRALALKLDLGFFEGSGTAPEIRGLKNVSGIQTVSMGTNGATLTNLDPFADAIALLEQENATAGAIVMHPRSWKAVIKLKEVPGTSIKPLIQDEAGGAGAAPRRSIYGVPVLLTSRLSITETQGTATDASSAYLYQPDQVIAVRRQDARIELDTSRRFNSDESEVRAISRWDVVVPNPKAVCRVLGIIP